MRIIVMSDSHGDFSRVRQIFEENPGADCFIHLGDGAKDFEEAGWLFPETRRLSVRGNCDFGRDEPKTGLVQLGDRTIFYTHGDLFQAKYGLDQLERAGRERGAQIVLYGHTHRADCQYRDGLWLLNPGSVRDSSHTPAGYLALDITPAGVVPVLKKF
jgi:putative phosphoesterase